MILVHILGGVTVCICRVFLVSPLPPLLLLPLIMNGFNYNYKANHCEDMSATSSGVVQSQPHPFLNPGKPFRRDHSEGSVWEDPLSKQAKQTLEKGHEGLPGTVETDVDMEDGVACASSFSSSRRDLPSVQRIYPVYQAPVLKSTGTYPSATKATTSAVVPKKIVQLQKRGDIHPIRLEALQFPGKAEGAINLDFLKWPIGFPYTTPKVIGKVSIRPRGLPVKVELRDASLEEELNALFSHSSLLSPVHAGSFPITGHASSSKHCQQSSGFQSVPAELGYRLSGSTDTGASTSTGFGGHGVHPLPGVPRLTQGSYSPLPTTSPVRTVTGTTNGRVDQPQMPLYSAYQGTVDVTHTSNVPESGSPTSALSTHPIADANNNCKYCGGPATKNPRKHAKTARCRKVRKERGMVIPGLDL
ncbi:hypothetical protein E1B28_003689 [Marasmius oreades]|uniref:Uncharacterized protein n=1 Tax=Marasmius oreades TaxID=181124 RepID=A0A9P8ABT5_9AGAR|nr:uncharacterized protein E1B28_003689 [Marasmius oreades]KAG7096240.1 hypothetical protein E1B28_003689 [Marasmius oreades]